jgi:L-aminopeptidase/D-esterase-like protein
MTKKLQNSITDVPGIRVGQAQDQTALTGCTVILCEAGAVGGIDQRGGAPGTRESDPLHPMHLVEQVNGVVLSGGSAFGLGSASGVMRYLEQRGVGFDMRIVKVPIVPAAILFDLGVGRADVRPDAEMGYQACLNASSDPAQEGNVGAGTGCTVGKILGIERAMKSGIGSASVQVGDKIIVAAMAAVNAFGDVVDPESGQIVAGARSVQAGGIEPGSPGYFADTLRVMESLVDQPGMWFRPRENTVIGVVATNAQLNKEQVNKVAQMAQDGLARSVRPAHTMFDGDTIFALATGEHPADVNIVGAFAAQVVARAILRGVRAASPIKNLPAAPDLQPSRGK